MSTYLLVKQILTDHPAARNSDRDLLWRCWEALGYVYNGRLSKDAFLKLPPSESITRARRKLQKAYPKLQAVKEVQEGRAKKEKKKGNHVFTEETPKKRVTYDFTKDGRAIPKPWEEFKK
jgi:hypothetical protein